MYEADKTEVGVEIMRETEKSLLLKHIGTGRQAWFPYSQIYFTYKSERKQKGTCVVPDWLLKAKGWEDLL